MPGEKKPTHLVTVSDGGDLNAKRATVEKHIKEQGGEIVTDNKTLGIFAVVFPKDKVSALGSHPDVAAVEEDSSVHHY